MVHFSNRNKVAPALLPGKKSISPPPINSTITQIINSLAESTSVTADLPATISALDSTNFLSQFQERSLLIARIGPLLQIWILARHNCNDTGRNTLEGLEWCGEWIVRNYKVINEIFKTDPRYTAKREQTLSRIDELFKEALRKAFAKFAPNQNSKSLIAKIVQIVQKYEYKESDYEAYLENLTRTADDDDKFRYLAQLNHMVYTSLLLTYMGLGHPITIQGLIRAFKMDFSPAGKVLVDIGNNHSAQKNFLQGLQNLLPKHLSYHLTYADQFKIFTNEYYRLIYLFLISGLTLFSIYLGYDSYNNFKTATFNSINSFITELTAVDSDFPYIKVLIALMSFLSALFFLKKFYQEKNYLEQFSTLPATEHSSNLVEPRLLKQLYDLIPTSRVHVKLDEDGKPKDPPNNSIPINHSTRTNYRNQYPHDKSSSSSTEETDDNNSTAKPSFTLLSFTTDEGKEIEVHPDHLVRHMFGDVFFLNAIPKEELNRSTLLDTFMYGHTLGRKDVGTNGIKFCDRKQDGIDAIIKNGDTRALGFAYTGKYQIIQGNMIEDRHAVVYLIVNDGYRRNVYDNTNRPTNVPTELPTKPKEKNTPASQPK